jgi:16S rRNA G966 N2-methylase RsmD
VDTEQTTIVRADALEFAAAAGPLEFDLALADPPYQQGFASDLLLTFARCPFAHWFWIEHAVTEILPDMASAHTRKYGDTALTSITAPE